MVFKWISASSLTFYYSKLLNNDSFNYIWCFTKFKHINLDIGIHKKREWIKPADFLWPVRYMHLAGLLHSSLCSWHNVSVLGFLPCTFIATSAWDVAVNLTTALYWDLWKSSVFTITSPLPNSVSHHVMPMCTHPSYTTLLYRGMGSILWWLVHSFQSF